MTEHGRYERVVTPAISGSDAGAGLAPIAADQDCPELTASCFSRWTYRWANPLLSKAYRSGLQREDIWKLPPDMCAEQYAEASYRAWDANQHKSRPLIRTIYDVIKERYFWWMLVLRVFKMVITFVYPFTLRWLLDFTVHPEGHEWWYGYSMALLIAAVAIAIAFSVHMYYWVGVRCALTVRGLVITLLFRKSLRMTLADKREHPAGTIVNLCSVDADNLMNFCWSGMHDLWCNPLTIVVSLAFLLYVVGPASLVGVGILVVSLLASGALSRLKSKLEAASLQACDERMRLMNEILGGMKLLKLYAWEDHFAAKVHAVRKRQTRLVMLSSIVGSLNRFVTATAPLLVSLGTFGTYILLGRVLDAPTAFTSLLLFNSLKEPLAKSPETVDLMVRSLLSIRRIQRVLLLTDRNDYVKHIAGGSDDADANAYGARIIDGSFDWGECSTATAKVATDASASGPGSMSMVSSGLELVLDAAGAGEQDEDMDEDTELDSFLHQQAGDEIAALASSSSPESLISPVLAGSPSSTRSVSLTKAADDNDDEEDDGDVEAGQASRKGKKTRSSSDSKQHGKHTALSTREPEDEETAGLTSRASGGEVSTARSLAARKKLRQRAAREKEYAIINAAMSRNPSFGSAAALGDASAELAENRARVLRVARSMADEPLGEHGVARVVLRDISISFPRDRLTIIVGPVGSGKSSLLACMIAEMRKLSGTVEVPNRVSYTPQQSWMLNDTLRENICFGRPFDQARFSAVVTACALAKDIAAMPYKDMTEIGENGLNLSGGQKQRLALARASYAAADLVLLDDPLSAVDAHVGKWLFDHVMCNEGLLQGKTRILVTHQLQFVKGADWVVVMKDGAVEHQGTYQDLVSRGLRFEAFVEQARAAPLNEDTQSEASPSCSSVSLSVCSSSSSCSSAPFPSPSMPLSPSSPLSSPSSDPPTIVSVASPSSSSFAAGAGAGAGASPRLQLLSAMSPRSSITPRQPRENDADDLPARGHRKSSADLSLSPSAGAGGGAPHTSAAACVNSPSADDLTVSRDNDSSEVDLEQGSGFGHVATGPVSEGAVAVQLSGDTQATPGVGRGNLTTAEAAREGTVAAGVYLAYVRACGGWAIVLAFTLLFAASQGAAVLSDLTLADWSNHRSNRSDDRYVLYYGSLVGAAGLLFLVRVLSVSASTTRAARQLHDKLFAGLMRAPLSFFDSTPSGRVLNRCSKDQEIADATLPGVIQDIFACTSQVLGTVLLICYLAPVAIPPLVAITAFYYFVQVYYLRASRVLKRSESTSRSPMYSHVTECIAGLTTIRAYKHQGRFEQECYSTVDANVRWYFYSFAVNRWLGIRLELIGTVTVLVAALIALGLRDTLGAGLVGLAITSTLSLAGSLNWMVRQFSEFEVQMNAVDRILEYAATHPEAPFIVPEHRPGPNWPQKGEVEIRDLTLRYREGLRPVLDRVSCKLRPAEKLGIVGRTGAGKSTLTLALFRIIEPAGGSIVIDGVDISRIGLRDLRSRLAIIPQDPVLFAGTLRSNLDPFNKCTDEELWSHLDRVHLREKVASLPGKLLHHCEENGDNFSVGERQLLCLGRALARKSKIVVMDEASASLDFATDMLIRELVQREFAQCTVLTIAHRLNTVLNSHRIMVLSQGRVVELDTPEALAATPDGHFASLLKDAHESAGQTIGST